MQASSTHIVLLGGGYVSVWAYRALVKQLRSQLNDGTVQITVVCPESYHLFHGWTAESLTNVIQNQHRMSPLAEVMPRATLVPGRPNGLIRRLRWFTCRPKRWRNYPRIRPSAAGYRFVRQ